MLWKDLRGHDQQKGWFETALASGRLASSFLFVGQEGIGKRTFAKLLAKSLLCRSTAPNELEHCGRCEDCVQVDANTHPDLIQLAKPAEKAFLPIELLIGEREKRMREGLCHDIAMRPFGGMRKIAIVDDADYLNNEGANCLLKTLEEPPNRSLIILLSSGLQRQLPTIRSRCQTILFRPLSDEDVAAVIPGAWEEMHSDGETDAGLSDERVLSLARQSGGSLSSLQLVADQELCDFHSSLLGMLSAREIPIAEMIKSCSAIVDAAGKDARLKRDRMRWLFEQAARFFRWVILRIECGDQEVPAGEVGEVHQAVDRVLPHWTVGRSGAAKCWNRCLYAIEQVDRNANQAALFEAWTTDIATLSRS